jgi:hypothetical protein
VTVREFDAILGHLIDIICPPNVSNDDPVEEGQVLDVLEKYVEVMREKCIATAYRTGVND